MFETNTRNDMSLHARLVDDLDALDSWATRKGLLEEFDESLGDCSAGEKCKGHLNPNFDDEFADIFESLREDIRELV